MRFNYTYRIIYGSEQCCDRSREQLTIEITREQYGRIIEKVIQGCTISEVPGIEELVKLEDSRKNGMAHADGHGSVPEPGCQVVED